MSKLCMIKFCSLNYYMYKPEFIQIQRFFNYTNKHLLNLMESQRPEHEKQLQLHQKQQEEIRLEMQAQSPLIGDLFQLSLLLDEFVYNQGFYIKVQNLHKEYDKYRKTRRDGSCFYRALTFSIFQDIYVKKDKKLQQKMIQKLKYSKQFLIKANFEGIIFEDMQELFLEKLDDSKIKSIDDVLNLFRDPQISNYLILMMRFITSGQLKNNSILYETFVYNEMPIDVFCQMEVEQMDKEADQIQIMALLNYLQVGIKIIYLDANQKQKEAYTVILPESTKPEDIKATLLYRPGHYDILYS